MSSMERACQCVSKFIQTLHRLCSWEAVCISVSNWCNSESGQILWLVLLILLYFVTFALRIELVAGEDVHYLIAVLYALEFITIRGLLNLSHQVPPRRRYAVVWASCISVCWMELICLVLTIVLPWRGNTALFTLLGTLMYIFVAAYTLFDTSYKRWDSQV